MRPIRTIVEALIELETTGRFSDHTRSELIELIAAENYDHPSARLETEDGAQHYRHPGL